MSKKKPPLWALIALGVCILLALVAFTGFVLAIWTGDERWSVTGMTLLFPGIVTGVVAAVGLVDGM